MGDKPLMIEVRAITYHIIDASSYPVLDTGWMRTMPVGTLYDSATGSITPDCTLTPWYPQGTPCGCSLDTSWCSSEGTPCGCSVDTSFCYFSESTPGGYSHDPEEYSIRTVVESRVAP